MDTNLSGLPPFLVEDGGVNSGFMIAQVTAAALASENKSLAHPASRRFAADVGEPGRSRQHGDLRGAPADPDGREHRADRRDRADRRGAGRRIAAAARDVAEARRRDGDDPRATSRSGTAIARSRPTSRRSGSAGRARRFRAFVARAVRVTPTRRTRENADGAPRETSMHRDDPKPLATPRAAPASPTA